MRELKAGDLLEVTGKSIWVGAETTTEIWKIIKVTDTDISYSINNGPSCLNKRFMMGVLRGPGYKIRLVNFRKTKLGKVLYK